MDKKEAIKVTKEFLNYLKKNNFNIVAGYLFGSYAHGKYHEYSDIDVAVIFNNLEHELDMQLNLMKISWNFDDRIESHPIDKKEMGTFHPLAAEVERTGIRII